MTGTMRDASLHFIRRYHSSTAITGIGHKLYSYRFQTLNLLPSESWQCRGNQGHNYHGNLRCSARPFSGRPADDGSTNSRTGAASLSDGCVDGMDFAEPKRWSRGGGLFDVSAHIDPTAIIESGAVVQAHAKLGPNAHVGSGSVVGPSVSIGSSTRIGYNVSLQNCSIGDFCIIHNGVCIGQDGEVYIFLFLAKHHNIEHCKDRFYWLHSNIHGDIFFFFSLDNLNHKDTILLGHKMVICPFSSMIY